jgi:general secretion pathway protein A
MTESESRQYIDHRLGMVGSGSADVFTEEALSLLCRCAKGVPRTLNILCQNALSVGQGLSERKISPAVVKMVQKEKDVLTKEGVQRLVSTVKSKLPRNMALAVLVMALIGLLIFFGKDYVPRILQIQPSPKVIEPAFKAKGKTPVPDPEAIRAAPGTPQTPAASVMARSQSLDEIRIKNMVGVKQGANLHRLSYQYYKETNVLFMDYIMESNPEITNPNLIVVNQKIRMPEVTESLLVTPASGGGFNVHIGTFLNLQEARRYRDQAASRGKDIAVVPRRVSKTETWYRVVAGPFVSRNEGIRFLEDMKHQGLLPFSYSRQGS